MLQAIGIQELDEQVYRAVLRHPAEAATELARSLPVSPARVRGALARLERFGLIRRNPAGRPVPVAPEPVLLGRLRELQAKADAQFDELRTAVDELTQDFRLGQMHDRPASLIEVIIGADDITRRAFELWSAATSEVLVFDKPPSSLDLVYPDRRDDQSEVGLEAPILARAVRIRGIYSQEALARPGRMAAVQQLVALGEQARTLPQLPIKLFIFDRQVAMVSLITDADAAESRAVIHSPALVNALVALFEVFWERASPIDTAAVPGDQLTDEETTVLRMLAAGMTDKAIARELAMSRRTASRRIERILGALDATTRFQAGSQAARRGWT